MDITTESGSVTKIFVKGTIDSVEHSDQIIKKVNDVFSNDHSKPIQLIIEDSYIILSRLIGNLLKLINVDKVDLTLLAGEDNLIELLTKLGLQEPFKLEKYNK